MGYKNKTAHVIVMLVGIILGCALVGAHAQETDHPMSVVYESPGNDLAKYQSLLINDLDVSGAKILPPPWRADKPFKWQITDKNVGALQAAFHESMRNQISDKNGYPIVTEPGPGVMELSVRIVSFMPYAEREEKVKTLGSGEMRIHAEARDSLTGALIVLFEGPQEVGENYRINTDFARMDNLKQLFDTWGHRIRVSMDEDHGRN